MKEYNEQVVETLDDAGCIIANKNIIIDNLQARIAELEEENARWKNSFERTAENTKSLLEHLAAEQLNNKRLRDALNQWIGIAANCSIESGCCCCGESIENHSHPMICGHSPVDMADSVVREAIDSTDKALSTQASTEALDKYVAEKVKDVQLQDIEQYLLQMAGISTAAIGYWKEDDSIHPDYDTPAIRDVAKLYANYESRTKQRDLAVEALENCRLLAARYRKEEWAGHIMRFCKDAGLSGSPIRNDSIKES